MCSKTIALLWLLYKWGLVLGLLTLCPTSSCTGRPLLMSHKYTDPSNPPVNTRFLSNAQQYIASSCPWKYTKWSIYSVVHGALNLDSILASSKIIWSNSLKCHQWFSHEELTGFLVAGRHKPLNSVDYILQNYDKCNRFDKIITLKYLKQPLAQATAFSAGHLMEGHNLFMVI